MTILKTDYAQMRHMEAWMRHPVLGDPSFDNFTRVGDAVHRSEPPYEWAVNGSIFCDPKTGWWYYYVACYPRGYWQNDGTVQHFLIYRSKDRGQSWENLGKGFPDFSCPFSGMEDLYIGAPDAVVMYDKDEDRYWMTYDWGAGRFRQDGTIEVFPEHGVALAWAEKPEGPFHLLNTWVHNNRLSEGKTGRFNRGYSSSTFKRKKDWICLIMQDSGPAFGWGLTCRTAKTPDGEWSDPRLLLSPDRPDYYPGILEYCFCVEHEGKLYAPATSVAGNRNYQVVFAADLEEAEYPSAWKMIREGSLWHAHPLADERYGIWGQTLHGFIEDGKFYTAHVTMDDRTCGVLSVASCPVDQPFHDGFTISGHVGKSVSPLLAAYRDCRLRVQLDYTGTVEIFLKYHGVMGPNSPTSNSIVSEESFWESVSVELNDQGTWRLLLRGRKGQLRVLHSGHCGQEVCTLEMEWKRNALLLWINQELCWQGDLSSTLLELGMNPETFAEGPLAVCAHEVTVLNCTCFEVEGQPLDYTLRYSAREGVLGGMHSLQWQPVQDARFQTEKGYIGRGTQWVKWSIRGEGFRLYAPKGPDLGRVEIWVDGYLFGTADLYSPQDEGSQSVYEVECLPGSPKHGVVLRGYEGQSFAVDILESFGKRASD